MENTKNYLHLNQNYLVNLAKVNFLSYSEKEECKGKATILGVDSLEIVPIYAISTSFNILQNRTLQIQEMIVDNQKVDFAQKTILLSTNVIIALYSSGCNFTNINLSTDYFETYDSFYFIRALKLEEKEFRIVNSDINTGGAFFTSYEILNSYFENIRLD